MGKQGKKGSAKSSSGMPGWQIAGAVAVIALVAASMFSPSPEDEAVVSNSVKQSSSRRLTPAGNKQWRISKDSKTYGTAPRHVRVVPNGGGNMLSGEEVVEEVQMSADTFEQMHKNFGGRLYTEQGQLISDFEHVAPGATLYTGPTVPGTHFMWPSKQVGNKVEVPGVISPSGKPIMLETLSHSPRTFYVHNFMSEAETDKLIAYSTAEENPYKMAPSTAGTHKSWSEGGRGNTMSTRTSHNAFDMQTKTSFAIKKRAFDLLRINKYDESMADGIQILRYEIGQAYIAHHDYFPAGQSADFNWDPEQGGSNRWATVFLYLSDVEYGGQTVFPNAPRLTNATNAELVKRLGDAPSEEQINNLLAEANLGPDSWEAQLIRKCYTRFAVPPRKGDAILFYSQHPDGRLDDQSLHGACPVLTGAKWGANLWVWNACRYGQCKKDPQNPAGETGF